ncbi:hypothetical protein MNB_SUP05-SYMBIONT-4-440 [hydrothermal vent metagenome]|uniref:Uncharacterized protein n=1 Tax=hydrothermal vent metagenome TaxID=652676 RepID=A0A1W1DW40_9ZZZZ|nr:hypothetical protein [Gammaproteobacteria bacterium]
MNKKLTIILSVIFIVIIIFFIFVFVTENKPIEGVGDKISSDTSNMIDKTKSIQHLELDEISIPRTLPTTLKKSHNKEQNKRANRKEIIKKPRQLETYVPSDLGIQEMLKNDLKNPTRITGSNPLASLGFSKNMSNVLNSKNPHNLISLNDMPEQLRNSIRLDLEKRKRNGFDEVNEKDADEITGILRHIINTSDAINKLSFNKSLIPDVIVTNYDYQGYTFPNYTDHQSEIITYGTLRRVYYRHNTSHLLIVEERSLHSGGAALIKELINSSVDDLPAMYVLKKSKLGERYAMLSWVTSNFVYSLYQVGNIDDSKSILHFVAKEITNLNNIE